MNRLVKISTATGLAVLMCMPGIARAASMRLSVSGKITGTASATTAVLMVANDGSSVRALVSSSGKFTLKVPSKIAGKFLSQRSGTGPTLHVLSNGEYAGPVVLGKASASKAYTRLGAKKSGTVSVGTVAMKKGYGLAKASKSVIDTKSTVRLKGGAPVGASGLRAQSLMGPVESFDALVGDSSALGADADRDGLPNFADGDINGDGVLDATQPSNANEFEGLKSDQALANRPRSSISFSKILQEDDFGLQINSNVNPAVTEEQIRQYLAANLSIEMLLPLSSFDFADTKVLIDCRKLIYCGSQNPGRVDRGMTDFDGKTLAEIQDASGLITMPRRRGENVYLLRFYPGAASAAAGNLAGDTFELVTQYKDQVVASEAKVVTSSVAAPMAIASIGNQAINPAVNPKSIFVPIASTSAIPVTFYRPQAFAPGSSSQLVDRGGLTYFVSIWPSDKSNTGYSCPASTLSAMTSTLLKSSASLPSPDQGVFDGEQSPTANGTKLGFTFNANACMAAQQSPKHTLGSGQEWQFELEARDSDGNKVRVGIRFVTP